LNVLLHLDWLLYIYVNCQRILRVCYGKECNNKYSNCRYFLSELRLDSMYILSILTPIIWKNVRHYFHSIRPTSFYQHNYFHFRNSGLGLSWCGKEIYCQRIIKFNKRLVTLTHWCLTVKRVIVIQKLHCLP
jgi:hypothetical protein